MRWESGLPARVGRSAGLHHSRIPGQATSAWKDAPRLTREDITPDLRDRSSPPGDRGIGMTTYGRAAKRGRRCFQNPPSGLKGACPQSASVPLKRKNALDDPRDAATNLDYCIWTENNFGHHDRTGPSEGSQAGRGRGVQDTAAAIQIHWLGPNNLRTLRGHQAPANRRPVGSGPAASGHAV